MTTTRPRPGRAQASDLPAIWEQMRWFRRDVDVGNTQQDHVSDAHIWVSSDDTSQEDLQAALEIPDYFQRNRLLDRLAAGMNTAQAKRSKKTYTDTERFVIYLHHIGLNNAIHYIQNYPANQEELLTDEEIRQVVRAVIPSLEL